ncbi:MAG: hypothetical protein HYU67_07865 [Flavobacteriia bacterium]|nr:hypothetical protein [Flavobacteriia bacterium]
MEDKELIEIKILRRLRSFIFGIKPKSALLTSMFIIHLVGSFIFFLWHSISYFVIKNHEFIGKVKNVTVKNLIEKRGEELGYTFDLFSKNLILFHFISITLWLTVFILGFFLYHKKRYSFFISLSFIIAYHLVIITFFGIPYYKEDTTTFDKISILVIIVNSILFYLQNNKKEEDTIFT